MQDLIDKTHSVHFELYRRNKMETLGFSDGGGEKKQMSLKETYELRRQDYMKDIQGREEQMRQSFVNKVKEKEGELKQAEQEVRDGFILEWGILGLLCNVDYADSVGPPKARFT